MHGHKNFFFISGSTNGMAGALWENRNQTAKARRLGGRLARQ